MVADETWLPHLKNGQNQRCEVLIRFMHAKGNSPRKFHGEIVSDFFVRMVRTKDEPRRKFFILRIELAVPMTKNRM